MLCGNRSFIRYVLVQKESDVVAARNLCLALNLLLTISKLLQLWMRYFTWRYIINTPRVYTFHI
jgi:hypothetical protein